MGERVGRKAGSEQPPLHRACAAAGAQCCLPLMLTAGSIRVLSCARGARYRAAVHGRAPVPAACPCRPQHHRSPPAAPAAAALPAAAAAAAPAPRAAGAAAAATAEPRSWAAGASVGQACVNFEGGQAEEHRRRHPLSRGPLRPSRSPLVVACVPAGQAWAAIHAACAGPAALRPLPLPLQRRQWRGGMAGMPHCARCPTPRLSAGAAPLALAAPLPLLPQTPELPPSLSPMPLLLLQRHPALGWIAPVAAAAPAPQCAAAGAWRRRPPGVRRWPSQLRCYSRSRQQFPVQRARAHGACASAAGLRAEARQWDPREHAAAAAGRWRLPPAAAAANRAPLVPRPCASTGRRCSGSCCTACMQEGRAGLVRSAAVSGQQPSRPPPAPNCQKRINSPLFRLRGCPEARGVVRAAYGAAGSLQTSGRRGGGAGGGGKWVSAGWAGNPRTRSGNRRDGEGLRAKRAGKREGLVQRAACSRRRPAARRLLACSSWSHAQVREDAAGAGGRGRETALPFALLGSTQSGLRPLKIVN